MHLEFLKDKKLLQMSSSPILRLAYLEATMDKTLADLDQGTKSIGTETVDHPTADAKEETMLLDEGSGKVIADHLDVPELAVEIKRAVWQVKKSLRAKRELREEKEELQAATKKPNQ